MLDEMYCLLGLGITARRIHAITAPCQVCFTASPTECCRSPTLKLQQMQAGGSTASWAFILRPDDIENVS